MNSFAGKATVELRPKGAGGDEVCVGRCAGGGWELGAAGSGGWAG
jgi:hypothetical protein